MRHHSGSLQKRTGFMLILLLFLFTGWNAHAREPEQPISPTDVYYIAKSVTDALAIIDGIDNTFHKKTISTNLKPGNVYEMALDTVEKFTVLHKHVLEKADMKEVYEATKNKACCRDVYNSMKRLWDHIIEYHIKEINGFTLPFEERSPKAPSDVFRILRQLSAHCDKMAKKKGIVTDWETPARVYDAVVREILPAVYEIANELGVKYEPYAFPEQPETEVRPRYVYKLLCQTYDNLADHYVREGNYDPVFFTEINDCDEITPTDVYALAQIISSELKIRRGRKTLDAGIFERYSRWKASKNEIVAGDIFRLVQHNFLLSKRIFQPEK